MTAALAKDAGSTQIAPGMLIDGKVVGAARVLEVVNPATAKPFAVVPDCSEKQFNETVAAANKAFPAWARRSVAERQDFIRRMIALVRESIDELSKLLTQEQGKPLAKATSEINAALFFCNGYCEMSLDPEIIRDTEGQRVELRYGPIGVVGAITAWNYPILPVALEARASGHCGQHGHHQAVAVYAGYDASDRRTHRRCLPAWRRQHRLRRRRSRALDDGS